MKKGLGILSATFLLLALIGCDGSGTNADEFSSDSSSGNWYDNDDDDFDEDEFDDDEDGVDEESSSSDIESSSSNVKPASSSNTTPSSSGMESSSSSMESSSSNVESSTSSTTSTTTPLLDYELTQPFIDEGWRDECLRLLNEYRATEDLEPMTLADAEKQQCAIDQAAADMAEGAAHGHFGDCGESAQNSGPNFSTSWKSNATGAVQYYEMAMWEKEKALVEQGVTEYKQIGHYLNMKRTYYSKVACGIAISADGTKGWFNMNFY
ncbi:MAG: hypothetical protein IKS02_08335 [Fibrobacter sp.]|nr:hypothetical protein [Fibrobacter sp.]